jgi:hypothetical protein
MKSAQFKRELDPVLRREAIDRGFREVVTGDGELWMNYYVNESGVVLLARDGDLVELPEVSTGHYRVRGVALADETGQTRFPIALLVAESWVPRPRGSTTSGFTFKNGDPQDIRAGNIEWVSEELPVAS